MPTLAKKKDCTGCMACMNICPKNAISPYEMPDGHKGVEVNREACVECGLCERTCPVVNGYSYARDQGKPHCFAAWADDDAIRDRGATTGIFGALASRILNKGGYVAGAVMQGLECSYILTSDQEDAKRMQGSKYTASYPAHVFREIRTALKQGHKVLFCGLPCHVAGLLNCIPEPLQENLYTADIVCGGVSSPLLISRFADQFPDMKAIVSFRDKENGWSPKGYKYNLKYLAADGRLKCPAQGKRNLITDGFACELTDRMSCYDCRFSSLHRKSDLTIGDLWGDDRFPQQHRRGVSMVMANTPRGQRFLEESGITTHEIDTDYAVRHNDRVYNGKSIKRMFPERRLFPRLIRRLKYDTLLKIYASDLRNAGLAWFPFSAYRLLSFRIAEKIKHLQNRYLLKRSRN